MPKVSCSGVLGTPHPQSVTGSNRHRSASARVLEISLLALTVSSVISSASLAISFAGLSQA